MPKKSTGGKSARKKTASPRPKRTRPKKAVLLSEAPVVEIARTENTLRLGSGQGEQETEIAPARERRVIIQTTDTPPVSPYVIDFSLPSTDYRLQTAEVAAGEQRTPFDLAQGRENRKPSLADNFSLSSPTPDLGRGQSRIGDPLRAMDSRFHGKDMKEKEKPIREWPKLHFPAIHLPRFRFPKFYLPQFHLPNFSIPKLPITRSAFRPALAFAMIALLFVAPAAGLRAYTTVEQTKAALMLEGKAAFAGITMPGGAPADIASTLGIATERFTDVKKKLDDTVGAFSAILPIVPSAGAAYTSGARLLDAGAHLTAAGRMVADAAATIGASTSPLGMRMVHVEEALRSAFPLIRAAEIELNAVDSGALPTSIRGPLPQVTRAVTDIRSSMAQTIAILPALESFIGLDTPRRYLVVFQNQNELRPTGGFIGSFALLDVDGGKIKSLDVPGGGSYDLACCLTERVASPDPLHLIEPHWQFHDANWFPDFPTSAKKLAWFYEHSGGPTVDGVIAINASVMPALLDIVGPIDSPEFHRTFTAANFIDETQKIVELEYDRAENKPKAVIGALAPTVIDRILHASPEMLPKILDAFGNALRTKDIQLYSTDADTESAFSRAGWTGEMQQTDGDYLMAVSANIAGGKTDQVMETAIHHTVTIHTDGTALDRVDITRTHHGAKGDLFTGIRNVDYVRVYVPAGSTLIDAEGFAAPDPTLFKEVGPGYHTDADLARLVTDAHTDAASGTSIAQEFGKTVFGNWMQTDPGETSTASITYQLPQRFAPGTGAGSVLKSMFGVPVRVPYTLLVEEQSGVRASFESTITVPTEIQWTTPNGTAHGHEFHLGATLDHVVFGALLFGKE